MKNKSIVTLGLIFLAFSVLVSCSNSKKSVPSETISVTSSSLTQAQSYAESVTVSAVTEKSKLSGFFKKKKTNSKADKSTFKAESEVFSESNTEQTHTAITSSEAVIYSSTSTSRKTEASSCVSTTAYKHTSESVTERTTAPRKTTTEAVTTTCASIEVTSTASPTSTTSTTKTTTRKPVTDAEGWINNWY